MIGTLVPVAAFAFSAVLAYAQTEPKTTTTTTITTTRVWTEPATRWQKGSDILGKNVQTRQNEKLGDVDDAIIDLDSGRILFYIVGCDGKECAIPAPVMTLPTDAKHFVASTTPDQMKAYSFEKRNYPNFTDRGWTSQVYSHYSVGPFWVVETRSDAGTPKTGTLTSSRAEDHMWYRFPVRTQRATELIGMDVRNQQNENLGKIEDLAIDPDANRVIYGVLSFGGFLGMGDKFFAVPWSSMKQASSGQDKLTLNVDKDRLKNASGFDKKNWPNMADQRWATETHKFYGNEPYWIDPTPNTKP
jgi:sporulation protein YlmC with PRC-barrel domain